VHETRQVCTSGLQYFPSTRLRQSGRRLTDHLGSTVAITDSNGTLTSQQRYLPFGGTRTNVTTPNSPGTDFGYTGQRQLDADMGGLMDYRARFYSPYLNRFIQPDSITPAGPQGLNRYSYVSNNPVNFNDPTGHMAWEGDGGDCKYKAGGEYSCTSKGKLFKRTPWKHPSTSPTYKQFRTAVGFYYPQQGYILSSLGENYDDAYGSSAKYKQPNSFGQMNAGDKGIYGLNTLGVVNDYLSMFAPSSKGDDNVLAVVSWQSIHGNISVTDVNIYNYTESFARIAAVRVAPNNSTQPTVYRGTDWVGHNGSTPGSAHLSLNPTRTINQSGSIFVQLVVDTVGGPITSKIINVSGAQSNSFSAGTWITKPDYGPWITK